MAKKSPPSGPPLAPAPDRERLEYLRWSCDRLAALLQSHFDRRARNETKAGAIVAVVNVIAGFVLLRGHAAPAGTNLAVGLVVLRIVALLGLVAVVGCWFQAVRVVSFEGMSAKAFTDDDGTTADRDFAARYLRLRDNLNLSLTRSVPLIEERAGWVVRLQVAACATFGVLFVLILLELLA